MSTQPKLPYQRRLFRAFLSHAHADKDFVDQLYRWLSVAAEIPIWYDAFNLSTSATISTVLASAIAQCQSMIIVLSKASIKSGWVEEEYNSAIGQRAKYKWYRIIPVRIEDCEIPGFLEQTKWIDMPDKKIDMRTAFDLITGLYYDDRALILEKVSDIYISRSWRQTESSLPDYVCQRLDNDGFRLIGDAEDQSKYDPERVRAIIRSCGGLVAILPDRGQGTTSKYMLEEIAFAHSEGIHCLVVAEPDVNLPDPFEQYVVRMKADDIESGKLDTVLKRSIEVLAENWHRPSQPHYVFLATNLATEQEQRNLTIKQAVQHITAMPCIVGDKITESHIREAITEQIRQAFMVIADISKNNINSCIEAGIAIGAKRPLNLIARVPRGKVPFILSNYQVNNYSSDIDLLSTVHRITFPFRRRVLNSELPR